MARDYKRAAAPQASDRAPGSWLSFLTGLGIGLVGAFVAYWWMQNAGGGPSPAPQPVEQVEAPSVPEPPSPAAPAATTPDGTGEQLSLPKFDFYKILPEIEVKVPEEEMAQPAAEEESASDPKLPAAANGTYILQVASFQDFNDADQAKAQLALQGVQARIQRVVIDGQDVWHRVHVGPFSTLGEVQKMRTRLSQLGVSAIVLRLGGGQ